MTVRGYTLAVDWSRNGIYTNTLEDVSSYVEASPDVVASWGRREPRATEDAAAGTLTFSLTNIDRQFSPENIVSPITGKVLPGTPVQLNVAGTDPPVTALPKTVTLTDNFHVLDTTKWLITSAASAPGWRGRITTPGYLTTDTNRYDLTSSTLSIEFVRLPSAAASSAYLMARVSSVPDSKVFIGAEGGNLLMREVVAGTVSDTTIAYDRWAHRWVRLRHDGTTLHWETSPNGSTWTIRRSKVTTLNLASVEVVIEDVWIGSPGASGRFEFSWLNLPPVTALTYNPPPYHFGTLRTINDTFTDKADDEFAGGNRLGMYEVFWDRAEGAADGTFDGAYATQVASETALIRSNGLKLSLGLGLHYPPTWTNTIANYRFVNEAGGFSTQLNYVFNQLVRNQAQQYFDWIDANIGFANVWSVRLTSGGDAEVLYPPAGGSPSGGWWAYDANAQGSGSDLPSTVAVCPYPAWVPPSTSITVAQAGEWYDWYHDSLMDAVNWQIRYIRDTYGYTGWFDVLTPGSGTRPTGFATEAAARFGSAGATTKVGAVWDRSYQKLVDRHGVVAYVSSMADNSGSNDVPTGADTATAVTSSSADGWSAYRWVVRVANEFGMPNGGENPGRGAFADSYYQDTTSAGMMAKMLAQSAGGKAFATYWAHSDQLWGLSTLTFSNWTAKIAALNTGGAGVPPGPP